MKHFLLRHGKTVVCAGIILYLSWMRIPSGGLKSAHLLPFMDKWVHFMLYALLSAVCLFEHRWQYAFKKNVGITGLFCIVWGGLMEIVQQFIPYRSCNGWDFAANCLGILCTTIFYFLFFYYARKRRKSPPPHCAGGTTGA